MLKLSLKEGQYVNIGDDIRIVFAGGTGKHCRLLIDAPKELNIARSNNEPDPAKPLVIENRNCLNKNKHKAAAKPSGKGFPEVKHNNP